MVTVAEVRACRQALLDAAALLAKLDADPVVRVWPPMDSPPPPKEEPLAIHLGHLDTPFVAPSWPPPPPPKKIEPLSEDDHSEAAYRHWRELLETRLIHGTFTKDQCLCLSPTWFILELRRREPGRF